MRLRLSGEVVGVFWINGVGGCEVEMSGLVEYFAPGDELG